MMPIFVLPILLLGACAARVHTQWRRQHRLPPRVVWGPTPIINIKYWSQAIRKLGYPSKTLVYDIYQINSKEDFDLTIDDFPPRIPCSRYLKPCFIFVWTLMKFDIFSFFFDGGFMSRTSLRFLECQLIKMAGKKIVVIPYGRDIAVPGHLGVFEESMIAVDPLLVDRGAYTQKRVLYFTRWADFIIRNMQVGFLPKFDLLWPNCLAIDTDLWRTGGGASSADGHSEEVVVAHSSNHRLIKGTDILIEAIRELQAENLKVRLDLFEKCFNEQVRTGVLCCDVLAEQFIGGYALSAVEGMSAGKPVLSNLSWHRDDFRRTTCLKECPIVDTSKSQVKDHLRRLVENPRLREELGRLGREYALKYHSLEATGKVWDAIFRYVWWREPIDTVRVAD